MSDIHVRDMIKGKVYNYDGDSYGYVHIEALEDGHADKYGDGWECRVRELTAEGAEYASFEAFGHEGMMIYLEEVPEEEVVRPAPNYTI